MYSCSQVVCESNTLFNHFIYVAGDTAFRGMGIDEAEINPVTDNFAFRCRDDQTSADSSFANEAAGAMSWAFLTSLNRNPQQNYVQMLQSTRELLINKYSQIPQLSVSFVTGTLRELLLIFRYISVVCRLI